MKKEKKLQVWLTKDVEEKLKELAKKEGRNVSDIVRDAINQYFSKIEITSPVENIINNPEFLKKLENQIISDENFIEKIVTSPIFQEKSKEVIKVHLKEIIQKIRNNLMYTTNKNFSDVDVHNIVRIIEKW